MLGVRLLYAGCSSGDKQHGLPSEPSSVITQDANERLTSEDDEDIFLRW